jgi:hypothetical protein
VISILNRELVEQARGIHQRLLLFSFYFSSVFLGVLGGLGG